LRRFREAAGFASERHFLVRASMKAASNVKYSVSGVQVHDAKLVAAICAHGIRYILTFNVRDFNRYDEIVAIHPAQTPVAVRPGS
jgi:predicted nucleic acid-binding protein